MIAEISEAAHSLALQVQVFRATTGLRRSRARQLKNLDAVAHHRRPRAWALCAARTSRMCSVKQRAYLVHAVTTPQLLIDDWSRGLSKHLHLGGFLAGAAERCHHAPARPTLFATRPKSPLQPEAAL